MLYEPHKRIKWAECIVGSRDWIVQNDFALRDIATVFICYDFSLCDGRVSPVFSYDHVI